jgi:CrcB protein
MRKYIFIALGGMLGALLRYVIKNIHIYNYKEVIPVDTLFINVSGSFLLAIILTIAYEVFQFHDDLRLGIATGFFGAYTTFGTLCKETVNLISEGHYYWAISYIALSVILGLAVAYLGVILGRKIGLKFGCHKNAFLDMKMDDLKEGE